MVRPPVHQGALPGGPARAPPGEGEVVGAHPPVRDPEDRERLGGGGAYRKDRPRLRAHGWPEGGPPPALAPPRRVRRRQADRRRARGARAAARRDPRAAGAASGPGPPPPGAPPSSLCPPPSRPA